MPLQNYHSGVGGTATVNGNEVDLITWNVNPSAQITTFRTSRIGPFEQNEANWQNVTMNLTIEYNFSASPFLAPYGLVIGATITNLKMFIHQTGISTLDGPVWIFPSAIIVSTPQSVPVNGGNIQTSFSFRNNGTFSYPSI